MFEIVRTVLPYIRGAGIEIDWLDLETSAEARSALEFLHVLGHGIAPSDDWATELARHRPALAAFGSKASERIAAGLRADDVVLLHDTQTALLCADLAERHPVIWHAHIGTRSANEIVESYWDLLLPSVEAAATTIFYLPEYAPDRLALQSAFVPPAVDPSTPKAATLTTVEARRLLAVGFAGSALVKGQGQAFRSLPLDATVVVQVSRWDPLKDMAGALELFARAALECPSIVGVIVGTDAESPNEKEQLERCIAVRRTSPDHVRSRLHIWTIGASGSAEHDDVIRVVQAAADVVVQKSLQEGFGLTVTEAMMRGKAVVASDVGGISSQIADGRTGFLVPHPFGVDQALPALRPALDPVRRQEVGCAAYEQAHQDRRVDRQLAALSRAIEAVV